MDRTLTDGIIDLLKVTAKRKYSIEMTGTRRFCTEEINSIQLTFRQKRQQVNERWKQLSDFMFMIILITLQSNADQNV